MLNKKYLRSVAITKNIRKPRESFEGENKNNNNEFLFINILKIIAAFIIVLYHYRHFAIYAYADENMPIPFSHDFKLIYQYGLYMVELFFWISGFTLMRAYYDRIHTGSLGFAGKGGYIWRRLKKLYPIYFISTAWAVLIQFATYFMLGDFSFNLSSMNLVDVITSFLMIHSGYAAARVTFNVPAWFMAPLFFNYILFFFLSRIRSKRNFVMSYCAVVLLSYFALQNKYAFPIFNDRMCRGLLSFGTGVLCMIIFEHFFQNKQSEMKAISFLAGEAAVCFLIHKGLGGNLYISIPLLAVPLLIGYLYNSRLCQSVMRLKPVKLISRCKLAYPMFLSHYPIMETIYFVDRKFNLKIDYADKFTFFLYLITVLACSWTIERANSKIRRIT